MKVNKLSDAVKREIEKQAILLAQASAIRLRMEKVEEQAKVALEELLTGAGLTALSDAVRVNGQMVPFDLEMASSQSSSLSMPKLAKVLTNRQLLQIATVSQKAAKEVLPQATIDQCLVVTMGAAKLKAKFGRGFPVPEVTLFPVDDEANEKLKSKPAKK